MVRFHVGQRERGQEALRGLGICMPHFLHDCELGQRERDAWNEPRIMVPSRLNAEMTVVDIWRLGQNVSGHFELFLTTAIPDGHTANRAEVDSSQEPSKNGAVSDK